METNLVVVELQNSDTTTVSWRDKTECSCVLVKVERDKTLGEMSIPNSPHTIATTLTNQIVA
jgi:hypothetical protein